MNAQIFDWKDYGNDIHIGVEKKLSDYAYKGYASRSEYFKAWYRKNKEKHIAKVRLSQQLAK